MAVILDKKVTSRDTNADIIGAIHKIASDKNTRILLTDALEWEQRKLKEIRRLTTILLNRGSWPSRARA